MTGTRAVASAFVRHHFTGIGRVCPATAETRRSGATAGRSPPLRGGGLGETGRCPAGETRHHRGGAGWNRSARFAGASTAIGARQCTSPGGGKVCFALAKPDDEIGPAGRRRDQQS